MLFMINWKNISNLCYFFFLFKQLLLIICFINDIKVVFKEENVRLKKIIKKRLFMQRNIEV